MYEQFLRELLEPLGIYNLNAHSVSGAEIAALGAGLDSVSDFLGRVEREAVIATAEEEGLSRRESLFVRRPAADTAEKRRAAIAALLQIDGDSLTPSAINRTIGGCGIRARAIEKESGTLQVIFPDVAGIPAEFQIIEKIIQDILPCHLAVEFYFRYLTWTECERAQYTWADVEQAEHTWESFQLAVLPED